MRYHLANLFFLSVLLTGAHQAVAGTVLLAPTESASKDVFAYQFFPTFNFDNLVFGPTNFGTLLAVTNAGATSSHNIKTLIEFDLSSAGLTTSAKLASATLSLHVIDGATVGFPVENPSSSFPITVDALQISSLWTETGVTWSTLPSVIVPANKLDTVSSVISGINTDVTFDVTQLVKSWLDNPGAQFGFLLQQESEVRDTGVAVGAVFASSAFGSNVPSLQLITVPEPTTWVLAVVALLGLTGQAVVGRLKRWKR